MTTRITSSPLPLALDRPAPARRPSSSTVRPEVVARGKALAADPSYPNAQLCRSIAEALLASLPQQEPAEAVQ